MPPMAGVVAFGFGTPSTLPGNLKIAAMADRVHLPIFTQDDIRLESADVARAEEKVGFPPPTLHLAREAVAWARQRRISILLIACARPHLWRCQRDLKEAIYEAGARIDVRVCADVYEDSNNVWFNKESAQLHARSRFCWELREGILRMMPFYLYKRIAH